MNRTTIAAVTFAALGLAGARAAHADQLVDFQNRLASYASDAGKKVWLRYDLEHNRDPKECRALVAEARKLGLAPTDEIKSYNFQRHPKAKGEVITVADADWICDDYARAGEHAKLRVAVQDTYDLAEWMHLVKPEETGGQEGLSKKPQACLDALDVLAKQGEITVDIEDESKPVPLERARLMCTQTLETAKAFEAAVSGREQAEKAELEAIYAKAGIKGKRLELFAYYGKPEKGAFLAAGCSNFVTTAAGLKKAKKLFIWLTAGDGTVSVRKYTFKGDNYTTAERSFTFESQAYAWCK